MRSRGTRALIVSFAALLFAAPALGLPAYTELYVFGDSIVDAGNTQNALGGPGATPCAFTGGVPPCDPAPASFGYFDGRFTNGPNAADVLNTAIEGSNSVESSIGGQNYSFGGARAVGGALPDLASQVGLYSLDAGGLADPHALYLINIGGNDVRDQVFANDAGTATLTDQQVIDNVVNTVVGNISFLQSIGAQHFLVNGIGDVGAIPEMLDFPAAAQANGTQISTDMSSQLFAALALLDPGIFTLDVIGIFNAVKADPAAFGLPAGINVTDSCLIDGTPPACSNFAFFDDVHPEAAVAGILGDAMIAAVPEPGTASLVALGLAGMALRRRA